MRNALRLAFVVCLVVARPGAAQQVDWSQKAVQTERSRSYDALHYRVALRLDLETRSFQGEATVTITSLRDGLEAIVLDAEEFTVAEGGERLGRAAPLRAVAHGADRLDAAAAEAGRDPVLHLRLQGRRPEGGAALRGGEAGEPGAGLLGLLAQQGAPLVPVLRLPQRQGHQRDHRDRQVGAESGGERPPRVGLGGSLRGNRHVALVAGSPPLDLPDLPVRRAVRGGARLVQDPAGELLGVPAGREEGDADLREDAAT